MTIGELLKQLRARDIRVWAEGARLRISAPRGALDRELQETLSRLKPELLAWLHEGTPAAESGPALTQVSRDQRLPLSFAQSRLWFLHTMSPEATAYHVCVNMVLRDVDVDALARAVNTVVSRHEVLRTTVDVLDGQPCQRIAATG